MATTPRHPVIKIARMKFKTWYDLYWTPGQNREKLRSETNVGNIGTALVARSFDEWSASEGQSQSPSDLHFHQGGHVSQFLHEWQFELKGNGVIPAAKITEYGNNCFWCVVDNRTHTVVMMARVYDSHTNTVCESSRVPVNFLKNFLGLSSP